MGSDLKSSQIKSNQADPSVCSRHFTENDYVRRFSFVNEVTKKPIMPRLKRDEIGFNVVPSVHAEAVTKKTVVSQSAKRRLERAVRSVKCFGELLDLFMQPKKASEIIMFIFNLEFL